MRARHLWIGAALAALVGCTEILGFGDYKPGTTSTGGPVPCSAASDCPDDGSPCTKEICANGSCDHAAQDLPFGDKGCDDGNPCTDEVCENGACAHKPASAPPDDGNECTIDSCTGGAPQHKAVTENTPCGLNDALKCTGGSCKCTSATECGKSTECIAYECKNDACTSATLAKGTLVDGKDKGDCLKNVCDGLDSVVTVPDPTDPPGDASPGDCKNKACDDMGGVVDTDDPSDVPPDDNNPCTKEACSGGTPILHEPVLDNTPCGGMPVCGPVAGGGFETVPANVCVSGTCIVPAATTCALFKCNPASTACLAACQGDGDCIPGTVCDPATNVCVPLADTGKPCASSNECLSKQCVDGVCCNAACGGVCEQCNDPANKGICSPIGSGLDPAGECAGVDACNGAGACAKPQAAGCAAPSDCLSNHCEDSVCCDVDCSGACKRCNLPPQGQCGFVPFAAQVNGCTGTKACDGNGTCKSILAQACGNNSECLSGFCQDGVCCNSACSGACAVCNLAGQEGTCTNVAQGGQVGGCNGANACDGNNSCKKTAGQACAQAGDCATGFCPDEGNTAGLTQRYCCNEACNATCKSCRADKTGAGSNGVCGFITSKTDPDNECAGACNAANGSGCCDGTGVCKP